MFVCFKQKTAYEMRISDWSSDVCSSDLDKLFVPVENIEVLSRYGSQDSNAQLDKLGGAAWQARKARVKKRLRDMAEGLLAIAAERELRRPDPLYPPAGVYEARKSAVSGKSGSVLVALGGRRYNKKNT